MPQSNLKDVLSSVFTSTQEELLMKPFGNDKSQVVEATGVKAASEYLLKKADQKTLTEKIDELLGVDQIALRQNADIHEAFSTLQLRIQAWKNRFQK